MTDNMTTEAGWDSMAEVSRLADIHTREDFERYLADRSAVHPEIAFYAEHGEWRDTSPLTAEERAQVERAAMHQEPNQCYYNAQTAVAPDLTYVEGYVVGPTAIPHAWIEINGKVAELTPSGDRELYDYYGVAFDSVDVIEMLILREAADPIVEAVIEGVIEYGADA